MILYPTMVLQTCTYMLWVSGSSQKSVKQPLWPLYSNYFSDLPQLYTSFSLHVNSFKTPLTFVQYFLQLKVCKGTGFTSFTWQKNDRVTRYRKIHSWAKSLSSERTYEHRLFSDHLSLFDLFKVYILTCWSIIFTALDIYYF